MHKYVLPIIAGGWIQAYRDLRDGFILPFQALESRARPTIVLMLSLIITWFVYVPIHELLHVAGCVGTGGSVSELVMGREYGANYLKAVFPFITPATSRYAGRVTGFEPNGDIGYLITVFAPFLLTVFPGVQCLRKGIVSRQIAWLGPGIVIGLASFYNLTGDFFEMGTILSTRWVNGIGGGRPAAAIDRFWQLRSDDVFRLIGEIAESPGLYGLDRWPGFLATGLVIGLGFVLAVCLAGWVYLAGRRLSGFAPRVAG
ncbi:hypothetical protein JXA80_08375 [bacterium]|nr:hypothetical protein [candidate division CSSED10-310 bacterium]